MCSAALLNIPITRPACLSPPSPQMSPENTRLSVRGGLCLGVCVPETSAVVVFAQPCNEEQKGHASSITEVYFNMPALVQIKQIPIRDFIAESRRRRSVSNRFDLRLRQSPAAALNLQ
ncbi:hypothetical protein SRHO_G00108610 [Serrasalmus rhombeus]